MPAYYHLSQTDSIEWLRSLPSESIDLLCTDPAYDTLEHHRAIGTTTRLQRWFDVFPTSRFPEWFSAVYRVMKPNTHAYVFTNVDTMLDVIPIAKDAGFRFWKPLIWDKVAIGMGYHYRSRAERILFFEKGKRMLNDLGVPDILTAKRIVGGYPTEKPVSLLRTLIRQSTEPGDVVADAFFGSGATGVAALELDRSFVGADTAADAHAYAMPRCQAAGTASGIAQLVRDRQSQRTLL